MLDPSIWLVILISGGLLALFLYPFFGPREPWSLNESPDRLRHLKRQRDRAMRTLKDLENDFREGSLAQDDYEQLRAAYKKEAIEISKELGRVREIVLRQISGGPGRPLLDHERRQLETLIARRKKKPAADN